MRKKKPAKAESGKKPARAAKTTAESAVDPTTESASAPTAESTVEPVPTNDGEAVDLVARVAALESELEQARDLHLRAAAETENARKRADEQSRLARQFALDSFARALIEIPDCLEAALAAVDDKTQGVMLTLRKLMAAFEANGIRTIEPVAGVEFDPSLHQAMTVKPDSAAAPNTVAAVLQKGYTLNGRVLRAAGVVVHRAPADDSAPAAKSPATSPPPQENNNE